MNTFYFEKFSFDEKTNILELNYSQNKEVFFSEKIIFHSAKFKSVDELNQLFFYTHIACGISYYKAFLSKEIKINSGKLNKSEADFFNNFYMKGLGEFAFQNKVKLKNMIKFPFFYTKITKKKLLLKENEVILVGGGKDSITSIEALKKNNPAPFLLSVVSNKNNVPSAIQKTMTKARLKSIVIERKISTKLIELNNTGKYYNGHVPVTGILAFIISIGAVFYGYDKIVLSNERSADIGNTVWDGEKVNHQWSKSIDFENSFNKLIQSNFETSLRYFSFLRPLSELQIVENFAKHKSYHYIFTSCNNAFKINEKKRISSWCCECDKCRFVFLVIAPFLEKKALIKIFGRNLFQEKANLKGYKELIGLENHKPFECVGEIGECILAFLMLKNTEYKDDLIIKKLLPLLKNENEKELKEKYLTIAKEHNLPKKHKGYFNETFGI